MFDVSFIGYVNESLRSPAHQLQELQAANGFTDADLALNRMGRIARGQILRLLEPILDPLVRSLVVLTAWVLVVAALGTVIGAAVHPTATPLTPTAFLKVFVVYRGL